MGSYLALHAAKEAGRDQMVLFDQQLREKRRETARTVERLRAALTAEQVTLLRELGCERVQGFYFSRPVPEAEAARLITESARSAAPL